MAPAVKTDVWYWTPKGMSKTNRSTMRDGHMKVRDVERLVRAAQNESVRKMVMERLAAWRAKF